MRLLFRLKAVYIRILNLNQPDKMKLSAIFTAASVLASISFHAVAETPAALQPTPPVRWVLDWQDTFDAPEIDWNVWSKIPRGKANWNDTMSPVDSLYEIRDGILILHGIVNPDTVSDPSPYLTGGLWTRGKKEFQPGRFEVRARLHAAKGSWPAIWMLPFDETKHPYPHGGEIDLIERLNHDDFVYQTVHSPFTLTEGRPDEPVHYTTAKIDPDGWNVFAVELHPESVEFFVNGVHTHTYPMVNGGAEEQFPYYVPQHLLIDMQLGGSWVGEVDPSQLPVTMEIDWVKHYVPAK